MLFKRKPLFKVIVIRYNGKGKVLCRHIIFKTHVLQHAKAYYYAHSYFNQGTHVNGRYMPITEILVKNKKGKVVLSSL